MPEEKNLENETPKEEIVYASPMKRVWAWVGVVYMVILVLLMTYGLASGDVYKRQHYNVIPVQAAADSGSPAAAQ